MLDHMSRARREDLPFPCARVSRFGDGHEHRWCAHRRVGGKKK